MLHVPTHTRLKHNTVQTHSRWYVLAASTRASFYRFVFFFEESFRTLRPCAYLCFKLTQRSICILEVGTDFVSVCVLLLFPAFPLQSLYSWRVRSLHCSRRVLDFLQRFQLQLSDDCSPLPQLTGCQIVLTAFSAAAVQFNLRQSRGLQTVHVKLCLGACTSACTVVEHNSGASCSRACINEQAQTSEMSLRFKEQREHLKRAFHLLCKCPTSCSVSFIFY